MSSEKTTGQHALRKGRFPQENARYFITVCTEKRARILSRSGLPGMIFKCLHEEKELWELIASIVMTDHIHFVICLKNPSLGKAMKTFKGRSAVIINRSLERKGHVWQSGFFDHKFRDDEDLAPILLYMWNNPNPPGRNFRCNRSDWLWFKSMVTQDMDYPTWLRDNPLG